MIKLPKPIKHIVVSFLLAVFLATLAGIGLLGLDLIVSALTDKALEGVRTHLMGFAGIVLIIFPISLLIIIGEGEEGGKK